jgi:hypothetical protein
MLLRAYGGDEAEKVLRLTFSMQSNRLRKLQIVIDGDLERPLDRVP